MIIEMRWFESYEKMCLVRLMAYSKTFGPKNTTPIKKQ